MPAPAIRLKKRGGSGGGLVRRERRSPPDPARAPVGSGAERDAQAHDIALPSAARRGGAAELRDGRIRRVTREPYTQSGDKKPARVTVRNPKLKLSVLSTMSREGKEPRHADGDDPLVHGASTRVAGELSPRKRVETSARPRQESRHPGGNRTYRGSLFSSERVFRATMRRRPSATSRCPAPRKKKPRKPIRGTNTPRLVGMGFSFIDQRPPAGKYGSRSSPARLVGNSPCRQVLDRSGPCHPCPSSGKRYSTVPTYS